MNAVRYGVTRHQLMCLEVVLPSGEVIRTGGKFVKCSSGYDLTQLIAGSEGTLGVISQVTLKLGNRPQAREVALIPFPSLEEAIDAVPDILGLEVLPDGLEFMERSIIEIVEKHLGCKLPCGDSAAFLMVIVEAASSDEVYGYFGRLEEVCRRHGAVETLVAQGEHARRELLEAREKFATALKSFAPLELMDVVVPRSEIARFVRGAKEIARRHGVPLVAYGHAGDGNVHLHPLCLEMSREEWLEKLGPLMGEIYLLGASMGGAVSGEHGIGCDKKAYLPLQMSEAHLALMKRIKLAFDPHGILNPGKIFDL